jgi:enoyl-CoA hydratase
MARKLVKWSAPYRGENVERPVYDLIDYQKDGEIGRIVLNSPEKRNPLGYERMLQIEMAAKEMELDEDIKVIIIKGEGPSFCSGYDITPTKPGEPRRNSPENGYIHPDRDAIWQSYDHEHLRVYLTLWDLQNPSSPRSRATAWPGARSWPGSAISGSSPMTPRSAGRSGATGRPATCNTFLGSSA